MKRCIVCGNIGDENSTACEVCGNPYVDVGDDAPEAMRTEPAVEQNAAPAEAGYEPEEELPKRLETPKQPEAAAPEKAPVQKPQPERKRPAAPAGRGEARRPAGSQSAGRAPRRTKSGPQIYGQAPGSDADFSRPQGTAAGKMTGEHPSGTGRPAGGNPNRTVKRTPQPQGRPAPRPAQTRPAGRQERPAQGNPQARPAGQMQNRAERPANPMMGEGQNRPVNQPPRGMAGRPDMVPGGFPGRNTDGGSRELMETAKSMMRSPVFVLIAVLFTISLISSLAAIFMNQLNYSQAVRLINELSLPAQMSGYIDSIVAVLARLDSGAIAANLALHVTDLLFCIGLWLIVITSRTAEGPMSGAGFVFMKITVIIEMLKNCIIMLLLLVVSVALVIAAWVAQTRGMLVVSIVTLVLVIIITMMIIMYYFCYLATIKSCRRNAGRGEVYGKVSGYVAIVHIILSLTSVISILSGIVNAEITGIVGGVGRLGWMILFGVWIFMYRGEVGEEE